MLKLSRAALLAATLGLAAPAAFVLPVAAQAETQSPAVPFELKIPSVVAIDSSMSEDQIKDVFTSNFLSQADGLARLTASSITIPEISLSINMGEAGSGSVTYRDIVLTNVRDGLAEKLSVGSGETISQGETTRYETITADGFDLKRLLEFSGIVKGDANAAMKPVFGSAASGGSTQTGPMYNCTFGPSSTASLEAKPINVLLTDVIGVIEQFKDADEPPPEAINVIVGYAVDIFRLVPWRRRHRGRGRLHRAGRDAHLRSRSRGPRRAISSRAFIPRSRSTASRSMPGRSARARWPSSCSRPSTSTRRSTRWSPPPASSTTSGSRTIGAA